MVPRYTPATARVDTQAVILDGGLDLISPPGYAKPGTVKFAINYELEFGGGYRRVGGFERFDGRPAPHLADYVLLEASAGFSGVSVGDTATGATSGATGYVCYVTATRIGLTMVAGGPFGLEVINVGGSPVGTVTDDAPEIDGFTDNILAAAAAGPYRDAIQKPPGTGPIRGVAVLNNVVYCWRDVAAELVTYKQGPTGWTVVPLYHQISFDAGAALYAEGSTLSQGGATATVKRVVTESGDWNAGTAAGRLIIDPIAGAFVAGAAAGGGAVNLLGPATQITMFAGGRVDSVVYNFTASQATRRLYCCDGVNAEWEFDGDVLVPISTGMGAVRATRVLAHKNHLFLAYRSSLQHSALGDPYNWTPLLGAGELNTGDPITNLRSVSGSESAAALMAICQDSAWVLYGSSSADWQFVRVSEEAGAQAFSAQEVGGILAFDRDDFRRFRATDTFGNFGYESESRAVQPIVAGATVKCSVLSKNKSKYRCFFSDGLCLVATPVKRGFGWMPIDYGRVIECAVGAEINGQYRIFMGDADGWVLEADVGRSFDGAAVQAGIRFSSQNQGSNVTEKQYRHVELESLAESAFSMAVAAEFSDADPDLAVVETTSMLNFRQQYGAGLFWNFNSWDRAYWDVSLANRARYPVHGKGRSITLLVQSEADDELPHTIKSNTLLYTVRRMAR